MIINKDNGSESKEILKSIVDMGIDFKLNNKFLEKSISGLDFESFYETPNEGTEIKELLEYFKADILPYCSNFSNPNFMGFPDSGNSIGGMSGALVADFLQQNLINNSFCAPIATHLEIATIKWLREVIGYDVSHKIENVWDVGGIITYGGTGSNATAMMLARENHIKNTLTNGVEDPKKYKVIIPKGIGHYSIKSSLMWIGIGANVIEVATKNFKYDLEELRKVLIENKGEVMCVVAYAGDSRTMSIDNFEEIHNIIQEVDPNIWFHADACHGFSLAFSKELKYKIKGIEHCDSISTDPHKVLTLPYCLSAILVKDPKVFKSISSSSDLIMQEDFALGQITPFIGSKSWVSLKIWFAIKNMGVNGIGELINKRVEMAQSLKKKVLERDNFILANDVDLNSVMFMWRPAEKASEYNRETINSLNKKIHSILLEEGLFHVHNFSIPDNKGVIEKDAIINPLRFMSGNPNITDSDLDKMLDYINDLGLRVSNE